jgi:excisionase family DNA binding protein
VGEDATGRPSGRRLSVDEAARHLGLSVDAIRKRVQRGTIPHEKDGAGRVRIILDEDETLRDNDQDAGRTRSDADALISEMRGRIEDLQAQLEAERQAHSEARTLLLRALERIPPAIEPPQGTPQEERPFTEEERPGDARSWWRRWFGG